VVSKLHQSSLVHHISVPSLHPDTVWSPPSEQTETNCGEHVFIFQSSSHWPCRTEGPLCVWLTEAVHSDCGLWCALCYSGSGSEWLGSDLQSYTDLCCERIISGNQLHLQTSRQDKWSSYWSSRKILVQRRWWWSSCGSEDTLRLHRSCSVSLSSESLLSENHRPERERLSSVQVQIHNKPRRRKIYWFTWSLIVCHR